MWVRVTALTQDGIVGTLDNGPDEPKAPIACGDTVVVSFDHIVDVRWQTPENAPPLAPRREYWARCLVDDCVTKGEEPVEYLYREEPDTAQEGDTYPDSGWRIRGRQGDLGDAGMEARKFAYVALARVLNRDDSWLGLIDAPVGSAFMRDFETGEYRLVA